MGLLGMKWWGSVCQGQSHLLDLSPPQRLGAPRMELSMLPSGSGWLTVVPRDTDKGTQGALGGG